MDVFDTGLIGMHFLSSGRNRAGLTFEQGFLFLADRIRVVSGRVEDHP